MKLKSLNWDKTQLKAYKISKTQIVTKFNNSNCDKTQIITKLNNSNSDQKTIPDGKEITQVQLFHLANSINNTEINQEIDAYLPEIEEVLKDNTKEELIKKVFSVEFTRFFNYYKKAKDLNQNAVAAFKEESGDTTRYFINVGRKDDFDWMKLKDFLKEMTGLGQDGIYRVDCKDAFSFFNTDTEHKEKVLALFEDYRLDGRRVSVEETQGGGGRGGNRGGGGRGRSGGGRRGGNDGFRGGRSGGRSGGDRDRSDRKRSDRRGGDRDRKPSYGEDQGRSRNRSERSSRSEGRSDRRGPSRTPDRATEGNKSPFSGKRRRRS